MELPNAKNAFIDMNKLTGYSLSVEHTRGKHKARVFESVLGLTASDAPQLRDAILGAIQGTEAVPSETDDYGRRFTVDFIMRTDVGEATVRTGWIIRTDEDFPRLTTCYVL